MLQSREKIAALMLCAVIASPRSASPGVQWVGGGSAVCTAPFCQTAPRVMSNGTGGMFALWQDGRGMGSIYIQSLNLEGSPLWQPDGVTPCLSPTEEMAPAFVRDDRGGAIIAWVDWRKVNESDIYARRVRIHGIMDWQMDGVPVCAAPGEQGHLSMCSDGSGGAIISWWDGRDGGSDLYAQRVDASGTPCWRENGVGVCTLANFNPAFLCPEAVAISDDAGGAIIVWEDYRASDVAGDIYAQRLDGKGEALWQAEGIAVCAVPSAQWSPAAVPDGDHGAIISWHDFRGGRASDIYAQRVTGEGVGAWGDGGVPICVEQGDQLSPVMAPDGEGGAAIAWIDLRSGTSFDVYAQRVRGGGGIAWGAGGVPLCAEMRKQDAPAVASDGAGGLIAAWHDFRWDEWTDIWANRISGEGIVLWQEGGIPVCTAPRDQRHVALAASEDGGAFLVWEDARSLDGWDIFAQKISANGEPVPALLSSYEARNRGGSVVLQWTLAIALPDVSFEIARSTADGLKRFALLAGAATAGEGLTYSFSDSGVEAGNAYVYRVSAAADGHSILLFETEPVRVPAPPLSLDQNYPNPFRDATSISYNVPASMAVDLSIFSCAGDLVARLYRGIQRPGRHAASWNGRGGDGKAVAPGIYYCTLKSERGKATRKIVVIR